MRAEPRKLHFGVLSLTGTGHLLPFLALARELIMRGHSVTFFDKPKIAEQVREAGVNFIAVGCGHSQQCEDRPEKPGILGELRELQFNLNRITREVQCFLETSPAAIANAGVDALLINEISLSGPTVAQMLGLPYFIISTSIPHRLGWGEYRRFGGYRLSQSKISWLERALLELSCTRMRGPIRAALDRFRQMNGLGPIGKMQADYPCLAHIVPAARFFDLPRKSFPGDIHYAGHFSSESARPKVTFPWERLKGDSLIYATLGTTRNVRTEIFRRIAEGCAGLDAQLVIALGNQIDPSLLMGLPGSPIVTRFAPQPELISKANVVISHGGLNTVHETLAAGKPMVTIPLAFDQPANSLRLKRLGVAEVLPAGRLTAKMIRTAVLKVMKEPRYREAAIAAQSEMKLLRGTEQAATLIENQLDEFAARSIDHYDESSSSAEIPPSRSEYCSS